MPNVKLYIDTGLGIEKLSAAQAALPRLRELLCRELNVDQNACHLAVVPVHALQDQPMINAEMLILPRPERTRERLTEICAMVQSFLTDTIGHKTAVRSSMLDAATYIALK